MYDGFRHHVYLPTKDITMSIKTNGVSLTKTPRVSLHKRDADSRIKTATQRATRINTTHAGR